MLVVYFTPSASLRSNVPCHMIAAQISRHVGLRGCVWAPNAICQYMYDSIVHQNSLLSMPFLYPSTAPSRGPRSRSSLYPIIQESPPQPVDPASVPSTIIRDGFELSKRLVDRSVPAWSLPTGELDEENVMPRTDATRSAIDARQV